MNTVLCYLKDKDVFHGPATVLTCSRDDKGPYLILDQTWFYPQGGGQPSDTGIIEAEGNRIYIQKVKWAENQVRHYTDRESSDWVGKSVHCYIDREVRILHSKLHSSGHLIGQIVESDFHGWKNIKGHHFPNECFVEFSWVAVGPAADLSLMSLNERVKKIIEADLPNESKEVSPDQLKSLCPTLTFEPPQDQLCRIVRMGDFPFSPCGGTHVQRTGELKGLVATRFKAKNGSLKVYYELNS
jgi:alanyl-tRNA synthetase